MTEMFDHMVMRLRNYSVHVTYSEVIQNKSKTGIIDQNGRWK